MGNGEEKGQGKCEQDQQEVPGNTKCLPQRLVWTTVQGDGQGQGDGDGCSYEPTQHITEWVGLLLGTSPP